MTEMIRMKQRMDNNLKIICQTAEERETLMVMIQEKTTQNDELMSLMIEMSDRQELMSEDLEEGYTSMSDEARTMKREIVGMHACMLEMESQLL